LRSLAAIALVLLLALVVCVPFRSIRSVSG
jgi:hypothetical protein